MDSEQIQNLGHLTQIAAAVSSLTSNILQGTWAEVVNGLDVCSRWCAYQNVPMYQKNLISTSIKLNQLFILISCGYLNITI